MKVVDLAGNDGAVDTQLVTIAFTGPNNLITITSITDDTGSSSSDFVTNDNNGLTVAATLTNTLDTGAGEKLMYSNDNGVTWIDITSSVTATAVSYDDANLTSTATVKMKVVDVSDNDGPVATQDVIIDTTIDTNGNGKTVTIESITDDTGIANDFITSDTNLEVSGTVDLADGNTLSVSANGNTYTTANTELSVDGSGNWSLDLKGTTLVDGTTYPIVATVTDIAGNSTNATQDVIIDTTIDTNGNGKTVTIESITDDTGIANDFITSDTNLEVSGTVDLADGNTLSVSANGNTYTTANTELSVDGSGNWSLDLKGTTLVDGTTYPIVATVTDIAGNSTNATQNVVVDTTAPTTTVDITSITDDTGSDTNDFITNDNDGLTIGATLSAGLASDEALMYSNDNGVTWSDITSSVTGTTVSYDDANLTSTNTVQMKVVDTAGNNETVESQEVTIDTTAPSITTKTSSVSEEALANGLQDTNGGPDTTNLGAVTGTMSISDASEISEITLASQTAGTTSGGVAVTWASTTAAGVHTLTATAGATTVATLTLDATGAYTFTLLEPLDHATADSEDILALNFGVTATDKAGNTTASTTLTINVEDDSPLASNDQTFIMPVQPDTAEGSLVVSYGADGGYVSEIGIDGNTYTYDVDTDSITAAGTSANVDSYSFNDINDELTINTTQGETFVVDMLTGEYSYAALEAYEEVGPEVSVNQGSGLLGIANVGALGAVDIGTNQTFTAVDANNNIESVTVAATATLGVSVAGYYEVSFSQDMADEFGLAVNETKSGIFLGLVNVQNGSTLTIESIDGGPIDNLQLNEFLATVYVEQVGLDLVSLGLIPSLTIEATDTANNTTTDTKSDVLGLSLIDPDSSPANITEGTSGVETLTGSADSDRIYGYDGADIINGGQGNDLLRGGAGNDTINGESGNDIIIGGKGNDTLSGGSGNDTFIFEKGDGGTAGSPASDTITDFSSIAVSAGGDTIDLSGLLIGELARGNTVGNLSDYLHFEVVGTDTVLSISTSGAYSGGFNAGSTDQQITFTGIDLVGEFTTDQEVISQLLSNGNLIVDQATTTTDELNGTTVISGIITDNDGDTASSTLTFDTTDPHVNPLNVAPTVQVNDNQLLGLVGVGAVGLIDLTTQALTAGDVDGNLRSVVVAYNSTVEINLKELALTASSQLANELGLQFSVVNDAGLLGLLTPSTTLTITAIDGGDIDNAAINELLATVKFDSDINILGLDAGAKVNLIDGTIINATDSEGLSSGDTQVSNLLDVDALEALLGDNSAIIEGDTGNDTLTGTADDERLYGHDGDDTINGGDGDDLIRGGAGNDTLNGGDGNDTLIDGNGSDTFNGGNGNDTIGISSTNFSSIDGGNGVDTLSMIGDFDFDLTLIDDAKISNIDKIDITGDADNKLTLNYSDLLAINTSNELYITGNNGDIVSLEGQTSLGTETLSGITYNKYDLGGTADADIWIDQDITVI